MCEFDVFLCYNSQDKPEVEAIANQLKQKGLKPWLDEQELRPGFSWQESVEDEIKKIKSAAVFVGGHGLGHSQEREIRALISQFIDRKCPVIPIFLASAPEEFEFPPLLKDLKGVDFRHPKSNLIDQLIFGINGTRPLASSDPNSLVGIKLKKRYKISIYLSTRNCEIYLSQDLDLPKTPQCSVTKLALQNISERDRILFDREVEALDQLGRHEQIPSLLAHFQENNDYYLVEEHIEGQALSEELIEG